MFLFSLGGGDREASYDAERSTATSLVFKYTVQTNDKVTDGIRVGNGPRTFRLDDNDHIRTLRNSQDALLDHDALGTLLDAPATVQTLVSNFGQPSTAERQLHVGPDNPVAHAFTTGSNSAGYGLDSIRINVTRVIRRPENFFASIWTTAGGIPQTKQFGLTIPVSITNNSTGNKTFTAPPNTTLNASTTYALVLSAWEGNIVLDRVATRAEDAGRAPGWSIANTVYSKASRWYPAIGYPIRIEVKGTILPDPADARLSALALSAAADDSSIALSPPFASSTTSYTASVAHGVDKITIAPTPTNNSASVRRGIAYLDGSDMPIPDADATKNHQQVSLAAGANTIKVKVTAGDGDHDEDLHRDGDPYPGVRPGTGRRGGGHRGRGDGHRGRGDGHLDPAAHLRHLRGRRAHRVHGDLQRGGQGGGRPGIQVLAGQRRARRGSPPTTRTAARPRAWCSNTRCRPATRTPTASRWATTRRLSRQTTTSAPRRTTRQQSSRTHVGNPHRPQGGRAWAATTATTTADRDRDR